MARHGLKVSLASFLLTACGGGDTATPTGPGPGPTDQPGPPASIVFVSQAPTLDRWGDTQDLSVQVKDADGRTLSGVSITWSSGDPTVAEVSGSGTVTTHEAGSAVITATSGSLSATLPVTVALQRNQQCMVPTGFPTQSATSGPVNWVPEEVLNFLPADLSASTTFAFIVDADNDGDGDVFIDRVDIARDTPVEVRASHSTRLYMNDGTGTFRDETAQFLGDLTMEIPRDFYFLDANSDGLMDVFIVDTGFDPPFEEGGGCETTPCNGWTNTLLIQQPGGGFLDEASTRLSPHDIGFTHTGDVGDVDCDGDADLVEGQWGPGAHHLRLNGGGILSAADARLPDLGPDYGAVGHVMCDLDRDGDMDLATSPANGRIRISVNDGFGNFRLLPIGVAPPHPMGDAVSEYTSLRCGDYDLDGFDDLFLPFHGRVTPSVETRVLRNLGDMTFEDVTDTVMPQTTDVVDMPELGDIARSSFLEDFNGDGWLDYLTKSNGPGRIFYNQGGTFEEWVFPDFPSPQWPGVSPGAWAVPGDVDGDGKLDLLFDILAVREDPPVALTFIFWNR